MTFEESDRYWAAKLDRLAREELRGAQFLRQLRLAHSEGILPQLLEDAGIRLGRNRHVSSVKPLNYGPDEFDAQSD